MSSRHRLLPVIAGLLASSLGLVVACSTDTPSIDEDTPDSSTRRPDASKTDGSAESDGAAPGKDDGGKNDGGKKDGGDGDSGDDAGATTSLFLRGDFGTDNVQALGVAAVPEAGTGTPVVTTLAIGTQVQVFDVTPDGTKVVTAADPTTVGRYDLVSANRDGSAVTTLVALTSATADVTDIVISPDGTKVAYLADDVLDGATDAYVVGIGGGTPVKVSPDRATASNTLKVLSISWSRDSKFLAIAGDLTTDKKNALYVTDTTVGTPAPVTILGAATIPDVGARSATGVSTNLRPIWTSGGKVCFKGDLGAAVANYRLYCSSPSGADFAELTNQPAAPALLGTYGISPDGMTIAFSADSAAHPNAYEVFKMPADGSAAATRISSGNLTAAAATNRGPNFSAPLQFSPNGAMIAFYGDLLVDGRDELYVLPTAGGTEKRVTVIGTDGDVERDVTALAWSPDSSSLAFIADHEANNDSELFRVPNVNTADQTPLLVQGVPSGGDIFDILWRE